MREELIDMGFLPCEENEDVELILGRDFSYLHIRIIILCHGYWIVAESGDRSINLGWFTGIEKIKLLVAILEQGT